MVDVDAKLTVRQPTGADTAWAVAFAGGVLAERALWHASDAMSQARFPGVPLLAVAAVLLVFTLLRRTAPSWAPFGPAAAMAWLAVAQPAQTSPFMFATAGAVAVLAYRAGVATARAVTPAGFAGLALAAAGWSLLTGSPDTALFTPIVQTIFGVLPWLLGRYRSQQRALLDTGAERIAQLEREQHMLAERVRLRERAELAEEMHDSLGHELSLIALRAGGLELAPELPEPQRAAVGELRAATAAATARLAGIVRVLRDGPPPERPLAESVELLVERARGSGMAVTLASNGAAAPEVAPTVHRIVREALTNAAKHAAGAPVTILVNSDSAGTDVTISNPRPPAGHAPGHASGPLAGEPEHHLPGTGHGLAALRERVRLLGGELHVARPEDGFRLSARLPHPIADQRPEPPAGPAPGHRQESMSGRVADPAPGRASPGWRR